MASLQAVSIIRAAAESLLVESLRNRKMQAMQTPISHAPIPRRIGALTFDAVLEEQHEITMEVTDNPVETGVVVSDHAYMNPKRVTITAGVSDVQLVAKADDPYLSGASRHREAFRLLKELQELREPFDVQTGLALYSNMVCTSIKTVQDKDTANILLFTAELREVIITSTQTVTYPPRVKGSTAQQAGKKRERGEQQGKQVAAGTEKSKSVAKTAKVALGG